MPHKDPIARKEWMRKYYERNCERIKADVKKRYEANRPKELERRREYFQRNKVTMLAQSKAWVKAHPLEHKKFQRAYLDRLRDEVIEGYGGKCTCCGETLREFLTIDHIHGDGKKDGELGRRGGRDLYRWLIENNFPKDRYQLLCMNCNWSKGCFGFCPHQRADLKIVAGLGC